jgi:hypothetical protein
VIFKQVNYTHKRIITVISFLSEDETRERCSMYRVNRNCQGASVRENGKRGLFKELSVHAKIKNDAVTFNI